MSDTQVAPNEAQLGYTWKHPVYPATQVYTPGIAPIKKEYILPHKASRSAIIEEPESLPTVDAKGETEQTDATPVVKLKGAARKRARREEAAAAQAGIDSQNKKQKQTNGGGGAQNKNRQFANTKDSKGHCHIFLSTQKCRFEENCGFSHDIVSYLVSKAKDIPLVSSSYKKSLTDDLTETERRELLANLYSLEPITQNNDQDDFTFVLPAQVESETNDTKNIDPAHQSIDLNTWCPVFDAKGFCDMGWKCRFLGAHVKIVGPSRLATDNADSSVDVVEEKTENKGTGFIGSGLELIRDEAKLETWRNRHRAFAKKSQDEQELDREEINYGTAEGMKWMRTKKYPLPKTKLILAFLEKEAQRLAKLDPDGIAAGKGPIPIDNLMAQQQDVSNESKNFIVDLDDPDAMEEMENALRNNQQTDASSLSLVRQTEASGSASVGDLDLARIRPSEKRRLNWKGELYLAPLTTTGNLPFRRICSSFGSDIHCGEMGLAESFLHGSSSEWSLVRRWEGERIFGTQLCGGKPNLLIPVAEALKKEIGDGLDFVDINCGCPIDLVYNRGAGSALLDHPTKLSKIVRGMNAVLGDTPLTIKLRTGTTSKQTTHKLFSRLQTEWGCSAATLHGRSRKQRYKNDADWGYIKVCTDTLRDSVQTWNEEQQGADEEEMVPIPIYGNGDVYSWQDYYERLEMTGVDGEMIARGALIKPWLFTEIKEKRDWDISSRERLDMIRQFASYGLSHWGSDTHGANTTRRFLCDMLSFTHRYVPTGLLEFLPSRINDRPPPFKGRDQLETLLASSNSQDWVKISEMFLGKTPEEWKFTPKHKSNSYNDPEGGDQQQG